MSNKYRIRHRVYSSGEETYTIQVKKWGMFWGLYTEPNGYGGDTIFVYEDLRLAQGKVRELLSPEITVTKEDYIYMKEETDV